MFASARSDETALVLNIVDTMAAGTGFWRSVGGGGLYT